LKVARTPVGTTTMLPNDEGPCENVSVAYAAAP
ncbi:unnamed protein product, partial [marine sediment metagenome]